MPGDPNPTSPAAASLPCQSSDGEMSIGNDHNTVTTAATSITRTSSQCSSQESSQSQQSQLFQLCEAAAMQEKLVDDRDRNRDGGRDSTVIAGAASVESALSRKRMADGNLKDVSMSPVARGHSRNVSAVSMASTSGSRIGELTADLKTRLSYAMVKVNHGWQTHTIDEVESLATHADSPTSSSSTGLAGRNHSTSPALSHIVVKSTDTNTTPHGSQTHSPYDSYTDPTRRHSPQTAHHAARQRTTLAPPAPIQPGQPAQRGTYIPTLLSQSQTASPRTPLPTASPYMSQSQPTPRSRPEMLYSPHQTVRDQDAIEALISMSSPGNNAHGHARHTFSPAASPYNVLPRGTHAAGRHALPTGQPRKSLPTSRPPVKRVGFERDGDVEMDFTSPHTRGPPQQHHRGGRRTNGGMIPPPLRTSLSLPAALGSSMDGVGGRRGRLKDEDIERMLQKAAERSDSSDDEEIMLPSSQRTHTGVLS